MAVDDAHERVLGAQGRIAADDHPDDRLQATRAENWRIFRSSGWVGPVGVVGLTCVTASVFWGEVPDVHLVVWVSIAFLSAVAQGLSFVAPPFINRRDANGLPTLAGFAHLLNGVVFGALLWLHPSIVERTDLRYAALMVMFALAAGSTAGLSGLHEMSLKVLIPLFTLGTLALLVGSQWILAAGTTTFLAIVVVDQRRTGTLWRELVHLRVDQERRTAQQRWLAEHDELTGLMNRSGLSSWFEDAGVRNATALYIDLDLFKEVNDGLGHAAGDEVLIEVARRLSAVVRNDDAIVRLGGDEFLLVISGALTPEQSAAIGRSIVEEVRRPVMTGSGVAEVSASVGIASPRRTRSNDDVRHLIADADGALLAAKRAGRDRVVLAADDTTPDEQHA